MAEATNAAFAIVIPARDAASLLRRTLPALAPLAATHEVLVVDDGSRDDTAEVAVSLGARVLRLPSPGGPAAARNAGARAAAGSPEILVFLDADVLPHAETVTRLLAPFSDPGVAAAFGSYDDAPPERSWISLYKNLAHHFVHQRSGIEASTFWAGCGAIRRQVLLSVGGFDERYRHPSIEDVELGYRLRAARQGIRLVPDAQVTHLKRWTLATWVRSDLCHRAIPWARLLRAGRGLPRDLNFTVTDRLASALVALGVLGLAAAPLWLPGLGVAVVCGIAAATLDLPLLRLCARRGSRGFALVAAGLHLTHRALGLAGLAVGLALPPPRK